MICNDFRKIEKNCEGRVQVFQSNSNVISFHSQKEQTYKTYFIIDLDGEDCEEKKG